MKPSLFLVSLFFSITTFGQNQACNCCTENNKAFDFWVGKWVVTNSQGILAGTNTITKEQGSCVIKENWVSARAGFTGTSYNFFNQNTQRWEQLWLDNSGSVLKLKGNRVGDQMILQSDEFIDQTGASVVNRISWTNNKDGTVRQLWEVIKNGSEITVAFDGLYKKQL